MRVLLVVSILIVYGSFYPFTFTSTTPSSEDVSRLFDFAFWHAGRADFISNVLLFLPFGLLGHLAARRNAVNSRDFSFMAVMFSGSVLAASIQIGQLWSVSRVPWGGDVVLNIIGIVTGYLIAGSKLFRGIRLMIYGRTAPRTGADIPILLGLSIIIIKLAPFVPSLDLASIKENAKHLIRDPGIEPYWVFEHTVLWLLPFYFLSTQIPTKTATRLIFLGAPGVLLLKFFVVASFVDVNHLLGLAFALVLWSAFSGWFGRGLLAILLTLVVVGNGMFPFELRDSPIALHWVPFQGSLEGNLLINIFAVTKKTLIYTSLIYLLAQASGRYFTVTVVVGAFVFVAEHAQRFFFNTTPEITDFLICLVAGFFLARTARGGHELTFLAERDNQSPQNHAQSERRRITKTRGDGSETSRALVAPRIRSLDGWRAIAALAVFMVHFQQFTGVGATHFGLDFKRLMVNGNTGVALFFVLSGFLLSIPFWQSTNANQRLGFWGYLKNRLVRIAPAYYVCLLSLLLLKAIAGSWSGVSINSLLTHLLFLHNLKDHQVLQLNPPFWTLAVEMQFYLLLPLVFVLIGKSPQRARLFLTLGLITISYTFYFLVMHTLDSREQWPLIIRLIWPLAIEIRSPSGNALTYSTIAHFHIFLMGVLAAGVAHSRSSGRSMNSIGSTIVVLSSVVALVYILGTSLDESLQIPNGRYNFPFVPILLTFIIYCSPTSRTVSGVLELPPIRWLGRISYGIYLFHYPILKGIERISGNLGFSLKSDLLLYWGVSLLATITVAHLSFVLLERPISRYVRRRSPGKELSYSSSASNHSRQRRVPDAILSSQLVQSRRSRNVPAAVVLIAAACVAFAALFGSNEKVKQAPWAGKSANMIFDHHTHTTYSDGSLSVERLAHLANESGCDAIAITDHSGIRSSWNNKKLAEIKSARLRHPDMLIFSGIELGMPSHGEREHVNLIVSPQYEASLLPTISKLTRSKSPATGAEDLKSFDASVLEAVAPPNSVESAQAILIYNHPSRKDRDPNENYEDIRRWRESANALIGIAGAPGHQKDNPVGSYSESFGTAHRWDPVVKVGGVWDQLAEDGSLVWGAIASSDFHNFRLDHRPCAFSRIHVSTLTQDYQGLLNAMVAGTFWADHGGLLTELELKINLDDLADSIYPGAFVTLDEDDLLMNISLSIVRGENHVDSFLRADLISSCAMEDGTTMESKYLSPRNRTLDWLLPINQDRQSCHVRARVVLEDAAGDQLAAYTNPIVFKID